MSSADDMVLAGSRPTNSNPIESLHSKISFTLVVDSVIICIMIYSALINLELNLNLVLIPAIFLLAV